MSAQPVGRIGALWALIGFVALIADALWRLTPIALEPILGSAMHWHHWVALAGWLLFMLYAESYKGFHLAFAPRFAARARHLAQNPQALHVLLGPLFCMGMIHATRKRMIVSWSLVIGIVGLVLLVRNLAQPWRGIVDGGVVVGLFAGTLSVLWFFVRAWRGKEIGASPDLAMAPKNNLALMVALLATTVASTTRVRAQEVDGRSTGATTTPRPRLTVMPLLAAGVPAETARSLDPILVHAIASLGRYDVLGFADINALLGNERSKDLVGCTDVVCASEIGAALDAPWLVTGTVHRVDERTLISIVLLRPFTQVAIARSQQALNPNGAWRRDIGAAVRALFGIEDAAGAEASDAHASSGSTENARDPGLAEKRWRWRLHYLATDEIRCAQSPACTAKLRGRLADLRRVLLGNRWTPAYRKERAALEARIRTLEIRIRAAENADRSGATTGTTTGVATASGKATVDHRLASLRRELAAIPDTWFHRDKREAVLKKIAATERERELRAELKRLQNRHRSTPWHRYNVDEKARIERRIGELVTQLGGL